MKLKVFLAVILAMCIVACSKDSANNNEEVPSASEISYKLNDNVFFFDEGITPHLQVLPDSILVINDVSSLPSVKNITKEELIFAPITETTPEGIMGTVESIEESGNVLRIKYGFAGIEDIFSELDVRMGYINLLEGLDYFEDESGNKYEITYNSDATKSGDKETGHFNYTTEYGSIEFAVNFSMENPHFYIENGKFKFTYELNESIKVLLDINFKKERSFTLPILKRTAIPIEVGDCFAFKPHLVLESGFEFVGSTEIGGEMTTTLLDDKYVISNSSGKFTIERYPRLEKPTASWMMKWLEMNGSVSYFCAVGIEYASVNENLAVGVNSKSTLTAEETISYNSRNIKLLETNPDIKLYPKVEITGFAHARLTKNDSLVDYETPPLSFSFDFITINLLPKFNKDNISRGKNTISAKANINRECYLTTKEQGFALFKKGSDSPLEHKQCFMTATKAENEDEGEVSFEVSGNPIDYTIKEYVKGEDIDEKEQYWYKEIESKISSVVFTQLGDNEKVPYKIYFKYDDTGRLIDVNGQDGYNGTYSYQNNKISYDAYEAPSVSSGKSEHWNSIATLSNDYMLEHYYKCIIGGYDSGSDIVVYNCDLYYSNSYVSKVVDHCSVNAGSVNMVWEGNNLVMATAGDATVSISYSEVEDNLNIDLYRLDDNYPFHWLGSECLVKFAGLSSKNLPSQLKYSYNDGEHYYSITYNFIYDFDEKGRVKTINTSPFKYSFDIEYIEEEN